MIPYGRHFVDEADVEMVGRALRGDWLTTGPLVEEFESALETVVGAPTVSVSSGTAALHCAYAAIGLGAGDEVITPPITFVATQATAIQFGAVIKFADVLPDTGNINPAEVEKLVSKKTKAIVAVDYAGNPAQLDQLREIADKYKIWLIEDAAHSLGTSFMNKPVGSIADLTTFSFFPTKNMTTGEGGAVASPHRELLNKARLFSRQGLIRDEKAFKIKTEGAWHQEVHDFGLNYRLPDILCALGISQLSKLRARQSQKNEIFRRYSSELDGIPGLKLPYPGETSEVNWHLYPIRVSPVKREEIFIKMRSSGIGVQVNYIPAYWHPAFDTSIYPKGLCPEAEEFYRSEISLPIYAELTEVQQSVVIAALRDAMSN
jgi:dTDP-4-amino-4,6-dideoxygalactose transaminase